VSVFASEGESKGESGDVRDGEGEEEGGAFGTAAPRAMAMAARKKKREISVEVENFIVVVLSMSLCCAKKVCVINQRKVLVC
jgi:hypothetical protein